MSVYESEWKNKIQNKKNKKKKKRNINNNLVFV